MPISVEEIIDDPDLAQTYTIYRSQGEWIGGRWVEDTPIEISACGTIIVASEKDLEMVPEGDRVKGMMTFYNKGKIYVTRANPSEGLSDKMYWNGDWYKIISAAPYGDYGFYKAVGARLTGN